MGTTKLLMVAVLVGALSISVLDMQNTPFTRFTSLLILLLLVSVSTGLAFVSKYAEDYKKLQKEFEALKKELTEVEKGVRQ